MAADTTPTERALGSIGTGFRLTRLYPATHPAVQESLRQITASLPPLAGLGTLEWKVGATGLHWKGQHLLPRNHQIAELAGLLYARGVRAITLTPGLTADHVFALYGAATGGLPLDDPALGRIALVQGRRSSAYTAVVPEPTSAASPASPAAATAEPRRTGGVVFRPNVLPADVECRRALAVLQSSTASAEQREAVVRLLERAPELMEQRDTPVVAEIITGLDIAIVRLEDPDVLERIGEVAARLATPAVVARMLQRLGEPRVPLGERAVLVKAVGALGAVVAGQLVDAYLAVPAELREPYRAAVRAAADRAVEPLRARLQEPDPAIVATAAQLLGLTGSPEATGVLFPLIHHSAEAVREGALHALAELGGREISRPSMPALKDPSPVVRAAAARAVGVAGDEGATTVLIRRVEQEDDEGVLAELLKAVGRLGAPEALNTLAKYAEPGGRLKRRTPHVRAAAIEGLGHIQTPEVRALLSLYSQDKEPTVQRAAEAALR